MTYIDRKELGKGFRDAFPVFLGYFAVSFTVGINAKNAGLTAFQASFMSFMNTTSAGQVAAIEIIGSGGSYLEILLSQIAINLRYLLMGAILSVRLDPDEKIGRRILVSFGLTDEIFALSSMQKSLNPYYPFGGWLMAMPGWTLGTLLGVLVNTLMPASVTSALSLSLYAMFMAIVIPPARKDFRIALTVFVSMAASAACYYLIPGLSAGMKVVVLTIGISALAAAVFPVREKPEAQSGARQNPQVQSPEQSQEAKP